MNKVNVGIVSLGHYIYFEQFEGLKEELMAKSEDFKRFVNLPDVNVIDFGYIDTAQAAMDAAKRIRRDDPDILFIILSTYVPSSVCAPLARYLDTPQVLIAIQPRTHLDYANCTTYMQLVNDDICAMPEITGVYERLGKKIPPCIVASMSQKDYIEREIGEWVDAARALSAFKYNTIGYLGHTYEGMYDMHTDPTAFTRAFGSHVKMLEMCRLMQLNDAVSREEIAAMIERIKTNFKICDPSIDTITDYVNDSDLETSARAAVALEKLVKEEGLTGLAYYYKGEGANAYEHLGANLIIGNTFLTSSGTPLAGEADLKTCAAMLIMNRIGGGGSFAEIHPFDTDDDVVLVGHDGPHNISISEGKPRLRKLKKYHGKSGSGIGVEFSLKSGPITMLSISVDRKGEFRMVAAEGESLPGEIPQTGNTNTRVSFGCPVNEFLSRWCEAGPTHHFALGIGHKMSTIRKFARISGIALVEVK